MFRLMRLPFFRLLAIGQMLLVARRHLRQLDATDRRRLGELVRRGRSLDRSERDELRGLLAKVEPRAFAMAAAHAFSPVPLPRRFTGRR